MDGNDREDWPKGELPILHPMETLARRPPRHPPRWTPPHIPRGQRGPRRSVVEGWHSPRIESRADACAVAIDFRYSHSSGATAVYSDRARRQEFLTGPHEAARWRMLESCAGTVDFEAHAFAIVWTTRDGERRRYTPDMFELRVGVGLVAVETKGDEAWFADPDVEDVLARAEEFLATLGVGFERSAATHDELADRARKDVADLRRIDFSEGEAQAVRRALAEAGATATVGTLAAAIGGHPALAAPKLRAMAARRLVDVPTDRPWVRGTPARRPGAVADPDALRAFLRRHAAGGAAEAAA